MLLLFLFQLNRCNFDIGLSMQLLQNTLLICGWRLWRLPIDSQSQGNYFKPKPREWMNKLKRRINIPHWLKCISLPATHPESDSFLFHAKIISTIHLLQFINTFPICSRSVFYRHFHMETSIIILATSLACHSVHYATVHDLSSHMVQLTDTPKTQHWPYFSHSAIIVLL